MLNLGYQLNFNLRTISFKEYTFFSRNTISVLLGLFDLIFALLTFTDNGVRLLAGLFLRSKILWYVQNFQWFKIQ